MGNKQNLSDRGAERNAKPEGGRTYRNQNGKFTHTIEITSCTIHDDNKSVLIFEF